MCILLYQVVLLKNHEQAMDRAFVGIESVTDGNQTGAGGLTRQGFQQRQRPVENLCLVRRRGLPSCPVMRDDELL